MKTQPPAAYPAWKAPSEDGASLVWPAPARVQQDTYDNQHRLSRAGHVRVQNAPLPTLRKLARQAIGHDDATPLIATGHQTELHHPGVWAKNPLMNALAARIDGQAYHLAVDTDAPKHLALRWPGRSLSLTDDPAVSTAAWSGLLSPPSAAWQIHLMQLAQEDRTLAFGPMLFDFLGAMSRLVSRSDRQVEIDSGADNFDSILTESMQAVDRLLGLGHHTLRASVLWQSPVYLTFVHHIVSRALAFAMDYNAALDDYRRRTGTRSAMRPMPNLFVGGEETPEAIEMPFWLDDLATGARTRPTVFADGAGYRLQLISGDEFAFDPGAPADDAAARLADFLNRSQCRLSPRALTLTMFVRLFLADQFVHGIGGGRYDQVTDQIVASHFGIAPPAFSVTTATLYFPDAVNRQRVCMPCLLREGHRLKHAVLGAAKMERVAQIAALPRASAARSQAFLQLQIDRRAAAASDPAVKKWEKRIIEAEAQLHEEKTLFDRELFYALQTRERLEHLVEQYRQAFV
jgi:hypothetical protein